MALKSTHSFVLLTLLLATGAKASLHVMAKCAEDVCFAVNEGADPFLDYYSYGNAESRQYIVIRFRSGAIISLLLDKISENDCKKTEVVILKQDEINIVGKGCLIAQGLGHAKSLHYVIHDVRKDAPRFLRHIDPAIWLSDIETRGSSSPSTSSIVTLDGAN